MFSENRIFKELHFRVVDHLERIYPQEDLAPLAIRLIDAVCGKHTCEVPEPYKANWDQGDAVLITYGDSVCQQGQRPLETLIDFLGDYIKGVLPTVHILPFFPYSSDDGFSVIHYLKVNDALGNWKHIETIARDFKLMADLVANHCSSRSGWFEQFKNQQEPGKDYFVESDPQRDDLSQVVRPRTSPLLSTVRTIDGERQVWCTFSHDQVDLNYANPNLLVEMAKVIGYYMDRGVTYFRLDAVAFLWKEPGTSCIHLPQTHEIIRLLRTLIGFRDGEAVLITETNVPNRENLSYFGNANEAHAIYNFSLPPLLVNALVTGSSKYLKRWMQSMPPAQPGTTYLNFLASHDGIGLRPAESLLSDGEIDNLVALMQSFGACVSYRSLPDGNKRPYEINISLIDAMAGTTAGRDMYQVERFLCAHAIMLALEGIPAIYVHSMLGTCNDYEKLRHSGNNRAINRHRWDYDQLRLKLGDQATIHARIYHGMCKMINIRRKQPAFHPSAVQFTMQLADSCFGIWRLSQDRMQSIFCINNMTCRQQQVDLSQINLTDTDRWYGLLMGEEITDIYGTLLLEPYQAVWLTNRNYS